jgi:hypothetical protein
MSELAGEQEHLDRTYAAYDALLEALSVSRRDRHGDEFTEEVLEQMRLERLRAYTSASGPLYFGRIDRDGAAPLYIGRHAVAAPDNELLAINWRAPAAEAFYAATTADPRGLTRRRRLDIEDRTVLGFVDEQLAAGGEEHLTDAIVEDITRQRVGEMRQIISTITPEQYELITTRVDGTLVVQGGPGTGKTAVGLHRAAWLLYADRQLAREGVLVVGPNRVFIAYIAQVLPSLGEQSVEQRPIDALVSGRPWASGERGAGDAARERPHGRAAIAAAVGAGRAAPRAGVDRGRARHGRGDARGGHRSRGGGPGPPDLPGRARALPRPARRPRRDPGDGAGARGARGRSGGRRFGGPADEGVPAAGQPLLAAADAGGAGRVAVQEPPPPGRGGG